MFNKFNTKNNNYTPPQQMTAQAYDGPSHYEDFTKSYVPEDEGSGYMLGYLSIVFGLLFNVIGMVLGVISIVRGIKKKKLILSLLGTVGIAVGVLSMWLYIQAFQLILPGVAYDRDTESWVVRQDDEAVLNVEETEYFVRAPNGDPFTVLLPAGLETRKVEDDSEHDFFITDDAGFQAVGDLKATILFFAEYDEAISPSDIRDLTNQVIRQDQSAVESASFGVLRDTHYGMAPDTIEVTSPTERMDVDHGYFEEVLWFEVAFDRVVDQQIVPTQAFVGLMYHREQVVLLSISSSRPDVVTKDAVSTTIESFLPR